MCYYRYVEILSCPTYWDESSRLRPLCHEEFHNRYHWWCNRGFHNKWWSNNRLKQFVHSQFQLQIDQVILCLKSLVNQQRLLADKNLEGTCSGVFFQTLQIFHAHTYWEESSRLIRPLCHRYSFHFRCVTDKIMLTLQVYFARSNGH